MSSISPDFIHNVGYLYEEMNIQDQDFLNENSDHYDAEMSYLVEDILSTISTAMIYEGYSASAIIGFLADSSTQDILEKYLTFDENILFESTISDEYIQEQLEIFDHCIDEGLGSLIGKVAKGAAGLAGRVASKPARSAVAKKLATSANPEKTRAAMQRLAQREARKGNVGGYSKTKSPIDGGKSMSAKQSAELLTKAKVGQVTQKVKDIATKAKPALQKVGKGAAVFGLGAAGGFIGAKMAGSRSSKSAQSTEPSTTTSSSGRSTGAGSGSSAGSQSTKSSTTTSSSGRSTGAGSGSTPKSQSATKPQPATKSGETDMQTWARLHPNLAAKVKPGQSGYEDIQKLNLPELDKPKVGEKQNQTPTQGSASAQIDTKSVDTAIDAEKERQRKRAQQSLEASAKTQKESYEIILEYLINRGHADNLEEANYIMMEMDSQTMSSIVDEYENLVIAENISNWVNVLLEEGYDLSEYTWDDIVEYYVNEAREDEGLTPLQKIRKRNKRDSASLVSNPGGQTDERRSHHKAGRGEKKEKGAKSVFGTMRHVGGPYK